MSEPFVGEIRMFAGNFAPLGWAFCDGQLIAVSQNDALFSLLGTTYGGDGRTTFGLPDLRGRLPIHRGHGPGLSERRIGSKSGAEKVTLTVNQMPSHGHNPKGSGATASDRSPSHGAALGVSTEPIYTNRLAPAQMSGESISNVGGIRSHTNLMPFLCVHFIISLYGIYPSRH
jgi:microcystin-dependent protein